MHLRKASRKRRGAMVILMAVVMILLFIGAIFSVDTAYMHMVRAELRTATDAAARAGASTLSRTQDAAPARTAAVTYAAKNRVAGRNLTIRPDQINFGTIRAAGQKIEFVPSNNPLVAVRVQGRRDDTSPDGNVTLFFGQLLNVTRFQPRMTSTSAANVRDVALVLDISGSMGTRLGAGTRLTALKSAVNVFLDELVDSSPLAQVSLSVYSTTSFPITQLTDDFSLIRTQVAALPANGLTAIGQGLQTGINSLRSDPNTRPFAAKTIILMTDGIHNTGVSPIVTVANAAANNMTVHTITFSRDANQSLMRRVAQSTQGGLHFHADDANDLNQVFREIAKNLAVVLIE
ncbi:MAG: VWA domain-containing protein [Pirellula sp.]|jgi:Flp pilus assembly protein TadG|nr:VWA domain-containing protein [Pirellula sp.]